MYSCTRVQSQLKGTNRTFENELPSLLLQRIFQAKFFLNIPATSHTSLSTCMSQSANSSFFCGTKFHWELTVKPHHQRVSLCSTFTFIRSFVVTVSRVIIKKNVLQMLRNSRWFLN